MPALNLTHNWKCKCLTIILLSQFLLNQLHYLNHQPVNTTDNNNLQPSQMSIALSFNNSQLNRTQPNTTSGNSTGKGMKHQRVVVSMTATPSEIPHGLNNSINWILNKQTYEIDRFYLHIPYIQLRNNNKLYPTTQQLNNYFPQTKVYINRLFSDYGPMSRYLGILELEKDPQTLIISFDIDIASKKRVPNFIESLVIYSNFMPNAFWVQQGENLIFNETKQVITGRNWERYKHMNDTQNVFGSEFEFEYQRKEIFRAVSGVAYRRWMLDDLWLNATDYHIGCFWDDDHWMSFNLDRKSIVIQQARKKVSLFSDKNKKVDGIYQRQLLGTLTSVNSRLHSPTKCPEVIMKRHPQIWTNARV